MTVYGMTIEVAKADDFDALTATPAAVWGWFDATRATGVVWFVNNTMAQKTWAEISGG